MLLTRDESKKLIEKILGMAGKADCGVTVGSAQQAQTRFANNTITTSGQHDGVAINIAITRDRRTGRVTLNETSDQALKDAVRKADELAALSPEDPEYVAPLGQQPYPDIDGFDAATAKADQAAMIPGVRTAVELSLEKKLSTAGYFTRTASALALGNSAGNFGHAMRSAAGFSLTSRTLDGTGSGWAGGDSVSLGELDAPALARTAVEKAVFSQNPRKLEPGKYTVVLEHAAVANLVPLLIGSFNARAAEEGRSLMTKQGGGTRLGEKMFSEKVTLMTDPFDKRILGVPWVGQVATSLPSAGGAFFNFGSGGGGGLASYIPAGKMTWIEKGVVKNLSYDRYWASKKEVKPTPFGSLVLEGEEQSVEDLIKSTERGLLVTRFWYIRVVNPQTLQFTGLTRDGIFMIENGKLAYPVNNLRFNDGPANVLANVESMSRSRRVSGMVLPAMKVRDFNFTSISDAV